ncbi:BrnT family toxin [Candidatus Poribacteria bacterium]|nr:BrnT family toxin [Candidatus Poribacteria bacterium]
MEDKLIILSNSVAFEWDKYNSDKNWIKHNVSQLECEQIFFNFPLVITDDVKHSIKEIRFFALGQTDTKRLLFIVFTIREQKIRIISARNMNKKERKFYENYEKNT